MYSFLGEDIAQYTFYAYSTNAAGNASACSLAHATYETVACPDDYYVPVEGNFELGTTAFCVMKT